MKFQGLKFQRPISNQLYCGASGALTLFPNPNPNRFCCARRKCDIPCMSREDRAQPLGNDVIIEYIVHGKFFYKESDVNAVPGAWWVPLRRMVKQLGAEYVK